MKISSVIKSVLITACFVGFYFFWEGYSRSVVLQVTVFGMILLPTLLTFHPFFEHRSGSHWYDRIAFIVVTTLSSVTLINWVFAFQPSRIVIFGGITLAWILLEVLDRIPLGWIDGLFDSSMSPKRVLIVGAGEAGQMVAEELEKRPELNRKVVAFADDDSAKKGKPVIRFASVVGETSQVANICDRMDIDEVIIAIPSAAGELIRSVTRQADRMNANLRIVPGIREIIEGDVQWNQIRTVRPEDLLGRETVKVDQDNLKDYLRGSKILVTGAAGSIGRELVEKLLQFPVQSVIGMDRDESGLYELEASELPSDVSSRYRSVLGDIRDRNRVEAVLNDTSPDTVIHVAALKHVPMLERFPLEGLRTNISGTYNVFQAASNQVEDCLFISTDKAVYPKNVMGLTKRIGEYLVGFFQDHSARTRYVATRFGNVLGSRGSVVPLFKRQIERGGPVTVTDPEAVRYFMTPGESIKLILTSLSMSHRGMIYVLSLGDPIRIIDLARQLISLSGYQPETEIPIEITGLREGEKQEERIFMEDEQRKETTHSEISRVDSPQIDQDQINSLLQFIGDSPEKKDNIISRLQEFISRD